MTYAVYLNGSLIYECSTYTEAISYMNNSSKDIEIIENVKI